jgi:hypothetical protein
VLNPQCLAQSLVHSRCSIIFSELINLKNYYGKEADQYYITLNGTARSLGRAKYIESLPIGRGMSQAVERLPTKGKDLSSNPSTTNK